MLGVEAMSLYRYVPGRGQVLDGVVQSIVDDMSRDPGVPDGPQHGWQERLALIRSES